MIFRSKSGTACSMHTVTVSVDDMHCWYSSPRFHFCCFYRWPLKIYSFGPISDIWLVCSLSVVEFSVTLLLGFSIFDKLVFLASAVCTL